MSEDEDDLEALRIAALATLKRKPEVLVPQEIPVVSSIQAHITPDGYPQHNVVQGGHMLNEFSEQFVGEYDYVPLEVQRLFEQGPRGRWRGRGQWGRGRGGYNNFPKPASSTSLIVLTTTAEEDNQSRENKESPKPFLLRPQDKWASTDSGSSVSFSPPRTKARDTSKFRRYDDDSDSEDDEDDGERQEQLDSDGEPPLMDVDVDDHRTVVLKNIGERHNSSAETDNASKHFLEISGELNSSKEEAESYVPDVANMSYLSITENVNRPETKDDEVQEQENSGLLENVSDSEVDSELEDNVLDSSNASGHIDEVENNSNIVDPQSDKNESDIEKPEISVEKLVPFSEIDNVSNSNSAVFSRFNRRRRRDSDSENDNSDNDNENNNAIFERAPLRPETVHSGNISARRTSRSMSRSSVGSHTTSPVRQTHTPAKTSPIVQTQKVSSKNDNSSSDDTSHESESDSDSSSLPSSKHSVKSLSPARSPSQSLSPARSPSQSPVRVSKSPHSHTRQVSPPPHKTEQISNKAESHINKSPSPSRRHAKHIHASKSYNDKSDVNIEERSVSANRNSPGRELSRGRSWSPKHMQSVSPKVSSEFDARNYRQVGMYTDTNSQDKAMDNSENTRRQYDNKPRKQKHREMTSEEKEERHFKEITRIKKAELRLKLSEVDSKLIEARRRKFDIAYAGSLKTKIESQATKNKVIEAEKLPEKIKVSKGDKHVTRIDDNRKGKHKDKEIKKSEELKLDSRKMKRKEKPNLEKSRSQSPIKTPVKLEKGLKSKRRISHSSERKKGSAKKKRKSRDEKVSDSESAKSVSSLSDTESESESETWRNKKVGASRKMDDIERERRQRQAQEREKFRTKSREDGDKRNTFEGMQRHREQDRNRYAYDRNDQFYRNRGRGFMPGRDYQDRYAKEKVYHRKNMTFYEEEPTSEHKTFFEEVDSDDGSAVGSKGGVVSVVRNDKKTKLDKMVDLKISRTLEESSEKSSSKVKLSKKERLVIQVNTPGDEDTVSKNRKSVKRKEEKPRKKEKKKKEEMAASDIEEPVKRHKKQVVNVTFDQAPEEVRGSVHDRLGFSGKDRVKPDKGKSRHKGRSRDSGERRDHDSEGLSAGKRMKLNETGKFKVTNRLGKRGHKSVKDSGSQDEGLSKKIRKIQEKNAEIIRRRREIDEDREQYG